MILSFNVVKKYFCKKKNRLTTKIRFEGTTIMLYNLITCTTLKYTLPSDPDSKRTSGG